MENILIYGGSSLISLELIKKIQNNCKKIIIFCRSKKNFIDQIKIEGLSFKNFDIYEVDLIDLKKNLYYISKINIKLDGIFWVAGFTGNAKKEYLNLNLARKNILINFLNPILIINQLTKKIKKNGNSFIIFLTSVAGIRGRAKNIFYGSSKAACITYLSGLRQRFNGKIKIITIIPGYMKTKPFKLNAPNFLVSNAKFVACRIIQALKNNEQIVYINFYWRLIMFLILLIPEKIFKKLNF
jgi:decaprenylphospho-beta-D-erythro-pentofuranosid-2-ulose 2-reductase